MKEYNQYIKELKRSGGDPDYQALYQRIDAKINKRSFLTLPRLAVASLLIVLIMSVGVYCNSNFVVQKDQDVLIAYVFEPEDNGTFWYDSLSK